MKDKLLRLVFTWLLSTLSVAAFAQTNFADYRVSTTDPDGKPLEGVTVR
jgi:hypothetical protein